MIVGKVHDAQGQTNVRRVHRAVTLSRSRDFFNGFVHACVGGVLNNVTSNQCCSVALFLRAFLPSFLRRFGSVNQPTRTQSQKSPSLPSLPPCLPLSVHSNTAQNSATQTNQPRSQDSEPAHRSERHTTTNCARCTMHDAAASRTLDLIDTLLPFRSALPLFLFPDTFRCASVDSLDTLHNQEGRKRSHLLQTRTNERTNEPQRRADEQTTTLQLRCIYYCARTYFSEERLCGKCRFPEVGRRGKRVRAFCILLLKPAPRAEGGRRVWHKRSQRRATQREPAFGCAREFRFVFAAFARSSVRPFVRSSVRPFLRSSVPPFVAPPRSCFISFLSACLVRSLVCQHASVVVPVTSVSPSVRLSGCLAGWLCVSGVCLRLFMSFAYYVGNSNTEVSCHELPASFPCD